MKFRKILEDRIKEFRIYLEDTDESSVEAHDLKLLIEEDECVLKMYRNVVENIYE